MKTSTARGLNTPETMLNKLFRADKAPTINLSEVDVMDIADMKSLYTDKYHKDFFDSSLILVACEKPSNPATYNYFLLRKMYSEGEHAEHFANFLEANNLYLRYVLQIHPAVQLRDYTFTESIADTYQGLQSLLLKKNGELHHCKSKIVLDRENLETLKDEIKHLEREYLLCFLNAMGPYRIHSHEMTDPSEKGIAYHKYINN